MDSSPTDLDHNHAERLDMDVRLIAYTRFDYGQTSDIIQKHESNSSTNAEDLTEFAGRSCYQSFDRPNPNTERPHDYIMNIIKQKHFSVLEHASATFYIQGVSRNLTHELIRHRHLSFSQLSQRFCDESERDFVMPLALNGFDIDTDQSNIVSESNRMYKEVFDLLTEFGYKRKQAREAARYFLLSGTETKIVVTGNHRAWREFLDKRLSPHADREIRALAEHILALLHPLAPSMYEEYFDDPMSYSEEV